MHRAVVGHSPAIVDAGADVILDWNFWSRSRRAEARERAGAVGVEAVLHWLDVPLDEAVRRARRRLEARPPDAHDIDEDDVRHFASIFEAPAADEGLTIEQHLPEP